MKLQVPLLLVLLAAGSAHAQMNNNQYHQQQQRVQSQNHAAEQNRLGYMTQQQQMQQQLPPPPPQPTGWWETTWGALAPSPVGGVLGAAVGASSKEEAERLAIADCEAKGGGACRSKPFAFDNQCAAMILGENEFTLSNAETEDEAIDQGMSDCRKDSEECELYYSACSKPVFHRY
ncbi:DUF4189 domain-containing protein [Marilutibacter chinensis]|uniref:DUF4189 domain-containing protein n=1 Tax=Marilutibacter chinensis TaxID=2912247 RepID=A0ABS9HSK8_9GAMM|nr:DUF4189 domain-containing protein [Lysobacter chinensis]MCF7221663.1 DUF4189 domain-containing protein [Lysobacter chinensis]